MNEEPGVTFQIIAGEPSVDFVNTLDNRPVPERRTELLTSYQALTDWAAQAGMINPRWCLRLLRAAETHPREASAVLAQAIQVRECLYRIFASILARRRPAESDLAALNQQLGKAASHLRLKSAGKSFRLDWEEEENPPLESVLWPIARSASDLLISGDLGHLRECGARTCRWMFVDRSKNHSRRWCDMKVCGNRVKVRKFYRRKRQAR
jgi:predicted RNA-binding Zn ribbon-like protein